MPEHELSFLMTLNIGMTLSGILITQNRHFMGIKHNIRPLYALLSASL